MPITLKDIADELNISITAVSRALRDMPDISPETTSLVKETAARLGYRKNLAASYLKTNQSMMLGVIVTDICNPIFSSIYKAIEKPCLENNYTLTLGNSNENVNEENAIVDNMLDHGVDGIFLVPSMKDTQILSKLKSANIPYVILQRQFPNLSTNCVRSDDYEGGYLAARHLYQLGHRRFLYVTAPMYISSAQDRYNGFLAYLNKKHLQSDAVEILECDGTRSDCYKVVKKWLTKHSDLSHLDATAIFCFSDYMAYGVYSAIAKCNLRIPEDISVIGYDNNEYSDIMPPALTTIDIQPNKIGTLAAKKMFSLIQSQIDDNEHIDKDISPKLVLRNSTGCPHKLKGWETFSQPFLLFYILYFFNIARSNSNRYFASASIAASHGFSIKSRYT